jgi:hypothetical protein
MRSTPSNSTLRLFGVLCLLLSCPTFAQIPIPSTVLDRASTPYERSVDFRALDTILKDGDIFYVKHASTIYVVRVLKQTIGPGGGAEYEYLKIGEKGADPKIGFTIGFPVGIRLNNITVAWSAKEVGYGYLYLTKSLGGLPPRYDIVVPFFHGSIQDFRQRVPSGVKFQHLEGTDWKEVDTR